MCYHCFKAIFEKKDMKNKDKNLKSENSFDNSSQKHDQDENGTREDLFAEKEKTEKQESEKAQGGHDQKVVKEDKIQNHENDDQTEIKLEMMNISPKAERKAKAIKLTIILVVFILLCLAIYLPLQLSGTLAKIDSAEKLQQVILSGGAYSYLIFFIFQFLQTTFLPIPAVITTLAGTLVFGTWIAFGISLLAVLSGSLFAYFLGKKLGRRLIIWVIGYKSTLKWEEKLAKGKYIFFLMMLFPFFPDDILCIVAGAINLNFRFFLITNLITRPIVIACTCFFGSGNIIPFHSWGIIVWIILIVIGIILFYLSWRYEKQIENFVERQGQKLGNFFSRKKDKNSSENTKTKKSEKEGDAEEKTIEQSRNDKVDSEKDDDYNN